MAHRQRTIREKATISGIGLHTGQNVRLHVFPAGENEGIVFLRPSGNKLIEVPALAEHVCDTRLATTLSKDGEIVSTVEHFLAAAHGLGIDNLRVEVSGPELPIMDGSAAAFVDLFRKAGIEEQHRHKNYWVVTKNVAVQVGDRRAALSPASHFSIGCKIDFNHPVISAQSYHWEFSDQAFHREIARARTFGLLKDVEQLKSLGLAQGGALDNAIVVDEFNILNPEGLRYPDEFVRHKLLDGLGDMALLGRPLIGKLTLNKAGHALHHMLIEKALKVSALTEFVPEAKAAVHRVGEREFRLPELVEPSEIFALG
jgi:UDP-3-O-[3-hydroxymyristoyl] N-acetylglucosamine deacetylase